MQLLPRRIRTTTLGRIKLWQLRRGVLCLPPLPHQSWRSGTRKKGGSRGRSRGRTRVAPGCWRNSKRWTTQDWGNAKLSPLSRLFEETPERHTHTWRMPHLYQDDWLLLIESVTRWFASFWKAFQAASSKLGLYKKASNASKKRNKSRIRWWNRFTRGLSNSQFVIFPNQTGTATSSPTDTTTSQSDMNIVNVMLWQNITWLPVIAETDEEIKQAIQDDCISVCQANGKTYFKKPA